MTHGNVSRAVWTAAAIVGVLALATAAQANLLSNGSFESGFTDWTVVRPPNTAVGTGAGMGATDGTTATIWNGGDKPGGASIAQSIATTPGTPYDLVFDYGVYGAVRTHTMHVAVDGTSRVLDTTVTRVGPGVFDPAATTFQPSFHEFTANAGSSLLTLTDTTTPAGSVSADSVLDRAIVKPAAASVVSPGGTGALGTANYLGGNLALGTAAAARGGSTTSSIDGIDPYHSYGASTPGGNDGAGKYQGFSAAHSWHVDSRDKPPTLPTWFTVDLGEVAGLPNPGTQTYAIERVDVYRRADCCYNQSDGVVDLLDASGAVAATGPVAFTGANPVDTLDFGLDGVLARTITYRNMRSFNEIEAIGLRDFLQGSADILQIDLSAGGNDFVNVEGAAILRGAIAVNLLGGYKPAWGTTFDVLSAPSIDASRMARAPLFLADVVQGGDGQILRLTHVPEPATLLALGGIGLLARRRRQRR